MKLKFVLLPVALLSMGSPAYSQAARPAEAPNAVTVLRTVVGNLAEEHKEAVAARDEAAQGLEAARTKVREKAGEGAEFAKDDPLLVDLREATGEYLQRQSTVQGLNEAIGAVRAEIRKLR
jgi:hypothetical protein